MNNLNRMIIAVILLVAYFSSCTKRAIDNLETIPTSDTVNLEDLDSIYAIASGLYLWSDSLPQKSDFNFDTYNSPESILTAFRTYSPDTVDKWSFAIKNTEWKNVVNGISRDFGIGLRFWQPDDLRIAYVQPNSSAGLAGLKRGYRVLQLNNLTPNEENLEQVNQEFQNANTLTLEVLKNDTINQHVVIRRTDYNINPILHYDVFQLQEKKIAYLNLFTFSVEASKRFPEIFNFFHINDAEYLIVDLRYNGGGLLPVMENLANYITSPNAYNRVMYLGKE